MMMMFFSYFLSFSSSLSMHACMRGNLNKRPLLYYFFFLDNYGYIRIIISQFVSVIIIDSSIRTDYFLTYIRQFLFFFAIYFSMCPIILILVVARNVIECKGRKNERKKGLEYRHSCKCHVILQLSQIVTHFDSHSMFFNENKRKNICKSRQLLRVRHLKFFLTVIENNN
jgi:hypothetical protein